MVFPHLTVLYDLYNGNMNIIILKAINRTEQQ